MLDYNPKIPIEQLTERVEKLEEENRRLHIVIARPAFACGERDGGWFDGWHLWDVNTLEEQARWVRLTDTKDY